jgi:hypothetical protein
MSWFLKAKHWQIFLLIFVIPFVIEIIGFILMAVTREPAALFISLFLMMAIILGTQFGWFYNVGTALAEKLGPNSGMNLRRFKNFVLVPAIYIGVLVIIMAIIGIIVMNNGRPSPYMAFLLLLIIPLHLFSIFCIFYSIWFVSKSLKMVERWNHVDFGDYVGEFFLTWFLFVGIWFLQPRINRLFDPTLPPPQPQYNPNAHPHYYNQQYPPQQQPYYPPQNPPPPAV